MTIVERVVEELNTLSLAEQQKVLQYVQVLKAKTQSDDSFEDVFKLVGTISKEDLEIMKQAIEEECEKIDYNEW